MFSRILVVCVGNICRSPMAEALLRAQAPADVHISSAGIGALVGEAADPAAQALMAGRGIDITGHRARQLTPDMAGDADLILVMEQGHLQAVHAVAPASCGKVQRLGKWDDMDIPDPYRKSPEYFARVLDSIELVVGQWSSRLWR